MDPLDHLLPTPRLIEVDYIDIAAAAPRVWEFVRHADLAQSPLIRALFWLRSVPSRLSGHATCDASIRLDQLVSTANHPGFQVLVEEPPHELVVGAIGKVWQAEIPFVHVADKFAYSLFDQAGFIKVAWSLHIETRAENHVRLGIEVRVDATDDESWQHFKRYFRLIGPASRFIRRSVLSWISDQLATGERSESKRPLPGDDLLPDAQVQLTHGITIQATPDEIWPWLVQMGCNRAGYYSIDLLDNAGVRSARELHPEWQQLSVGQCIANTPDGSGEFEVLRVDAPRALVLGGLFEPDASKRLAFAEPRPKRFWHVTWAFVLEPIASNSTRVHVRARGAFSASEALHASWIRPVHQLMEKSQLRHLRARAEGTLPRDDSADVLAGLGGAARMCLALATPFRRGARSHWGVAAQTADRKFPGDALVPTPRWSWTHGIEIAASAEHVWPWIAQVGADRAGFYSYQWLENVAGCELRNAERVHPEWEVKLGDALYLHPKVAPLKVVAAEHGHWFVAYAEPDANARSGGRPWVSGSWLFFIEPLGSQRCRFVSRYRADCSDDLATRLSFGPTLLEPIGFTMDRRMLLGVKALVERDASRMSEH
jgi:hypothetical protein